MSRNKVLIITVIIVAAAFAAFTFFFPKPLDKNAQNESVQMDTLMGEPTSSAENRVAEDQLVKFHSPILGNPHAPVTVVEFLDPECESCAAFHPVVKSVLNLHKDDVRFVVRYMLYHGNSKLAAQATEAAGRQGKYWEMQEALFARKDWTHQQSPQTDKFIEIARSLGLNLEKFRSDMQEPGIIAAIESDFNEGTTIGVKGTPTLFVNGKMLTQLSFDALKNAVEEELKNRKTN